jgi:transcriptional regulator with XRE-family HTH domain
MKRKPLDAEKELKEVGARLKYLRLKAGYTSAETFSNQHDLSRSLYGKYENAKKDMQFTTLVKLVNCHGLTLEEFFAVKIAE